MRSIVASLIFLVLWLSAPVAAQEQDGPNGPGTICVGGGRWEASIEETRRIKTEPVPPSFRRPFEAVGGCLRYGLDQSALVAWHLRFGDAGTVGPALRYLEDDYASRIGRLSRFHRLTVSRVEELHDRRDDIAFIAEQYLSAAEEFNEARFLAKAEEYAVPLAEAVAFLKAREQDDPLVRPMYYDLDTPDVDDFTMRIAVLKAVISRDAANLVNARSQLDLIAPPAAEEAAEIAYSGGWDFCDISDGWSRAGEVEAACADDDTYYPFRVTTYTASLARLELLVSTETNPDGLANALRLLGNDSDSYCCRRLAPDRLFRLRMAEADFRERSVAAPGRSWWPVLEALQAAEKLAPPYRAPMRFRQVASRWLSAWTQAKAELFDGSRNTRLDNYPEQQRYESYLRATLADLDAITGTESP